MPAQKIQIDAEKVAGELVAGKTGAMKKLAHAIEILANTRIGYYGESTAHQIWEAWEVIAQDAFTRQNPALLEQSLPIFQKALLKKPTILPHHWKVRYLHGAAGIPFLLELIEIALKATPRKGIEIIDSGIANPAGEGLRMLTSVLEKLTEFGDSPYVDSPGDPEALDNFARGLTKLRWTNDRLWILFRALSENQFGPHLKKSTGAVFLPLLRHASEKNLHGDGVKKLGALLVRAGHSVGDKKSTDQIAALPTVFTDDVLEAIALIKKWKIAAHKLFLQRGATASEIKNLGTSLALKLPPELTCALKQHRQIGEIHFGTPGRMVALREEIAETLEEHLKEYPKFEGRSPYIDVRKFKPLEFGIPLGTNSSGDLYFLATNAVSDRGHLPVIQFHHDMALTASVAASSLGEFLCFEIAQPYVAREGLQSDYYTLLQRRWSAKIDKK